MYERHRCDDSCRCPYCDTLMWYAPGHGIHGCVDNDCLLGNGATMCGHCFGVGKKTDNEQCHDCIGTGWVPG